MPLVYFDASAFVKLLTTETGSSLASALWDGCDAALSSRLAYPEVRAALAAAARNHDLTESELADAERDWEDFWAATRPVELTATVEQHAGHLARAHALRGADAVHLASALAVGDPGLVVAVWDRRLHTAQLFEHVPLDQLVTSLIMHHNVKVLLFCRTSDPDLSNSLSCFVDHWILFCRKTYLDLSTIVGLVAVVDLPGAGDWSQAAMAVSTQCRCRPISLCQR